MAARTDTKWFHETVFQRAAGMLFILQRLCFCRPDGTPTRYNSGAPSVLVAYGENVDRLRRLEHWGFLIEAGV